jgi:putative ABC transport system permease protein
MNKRDLIRLALKNFMRRKTRSILTILGVIIGTASIVVMLSLGIGMNESFKQQLKSMGSLNIINVDTYYFPEGATGYVQPKVTVLDDKSIAKIGAIEGVEAVTPILQTSLKLVSGKFTTYANIMGMDTSVLESFDYKVASGRLLNADDTNALLFGSQSPYNFYNPKASGRGGGGMAYFIGGNVGNGQEKPKPPVDVLNDKLIMTFDMSYGERKPVGMIAGPQNNKPPKLYKTKGVGILEDSMDDKAYSIIMNITYLKKLMKEYEKSQNTDNNNGGVRYKGQSTDGYQQAKVKVKNIDDVITIQKQINAMGFGANSVADMIKSYQKQSATMQAVLGGIGAISLLVAALGITNTMIMSIYERTREIGVMKVLGCLLGDIRNLFLFEAGMIGFIGGVAGLLFSYGASFVLNKFAGNALGVGGGYNGQPATISVIPVWLALSSLGFATLVGLISGFMPARRAMKLSALEAIKTE